VNATDTCQDFVLYRFFDADGELLYIGKSVNVWSRFTSHRSGSAFYPEATKVTLQRGFKTEDRLSEAEISAIRAERPRYNKTHNTRWHAGAWNRVPLTDMPLLTHEVVRVVEDGDVIAQGILDDIEETFFVCAEEGDCCEEPAGYSLYIIGEEWITVDIAHIDGADDPRVYVWQSSCGASAPDAGIRSGVRLAV
jgi:hypothetical protein